MDAVRLDKWLWAARFFKTRTQASHAANGGKVHVNGGRGKAGQNVRVGDLLRVRKNELIYEVTVQGLADRRGSAVAAQALYAETEDGRAERERMQANQRTARLTRVAPDHRPDRRDRRRLRDLKRDR